MCKKKLEKKKSSQRIMFIGIYVLLNIFMCVNLWAQTSPNTVPTTHTAKGSYGFLENLFYSQGVLYSSGYLLILVMLIFVAFIRFFFPKTLPFLFEQYSMLGVNTEPSKNERLGQDISIILLNILFVLLFACWIMLAYREILGINMVFSMASYWRVVGILLIFLMVKYCVQHLLSWIFIWSGDGYLMVSNGYLRATLALVLLPFMGLMMLVHHHGLEVFVLIISGLMMVLLLCLQLFKLLIWVGKNMDVGIFQIFTYLCTIKILPIVLTAVWIFRVLKFRVT